MNVFLVAEEEKLITLGSPKPLMVEQGHKSDLKMHITI